MKQITGESFKQSAIDVVVPTGDAGIDLTQYLEDTMRPHRWAITAVVTVATTDLILYGCIAEGSIDNTADDLWGLHNDKDGTIKLGKLGAGLVVGTHHFIVEDIGVYHRLCFVKSAGTVDVYVRPIYGSSRHS